MAKLNINAKEALAEIRNLAAELNALKKASSTMGSTTAANFKKMENSIKRVRVKVGELGNKMNYLKAIVRDQNAAIESNKKKLKELRKALDDAIKAQDRAAKATKRGGKAFSGFSASILNLLKAGGILAIGQQMLALGKNIFTTVKTFDSLAFTLEKVTKSQLNFENSQRFLLRITKAYGVELVTTTTRWSRFLAAAQESGLALRETENIFESMTKASAVLGLNTDELTSVYLALEQMLSKGKITTEELRRQLGERLPGAMGIMAASIGVTIPELDKMLKKGEVLSAEVLPDFAQAVERAYGIENEGRIETLIAKQNRLTASWQTFIKNISEGDSVIKRVFGGFLDYTNQILEDWDRMLQTEEQEMRVRISVDEESFKKALETSTREYIDKLSPVDQQERQLKKLEDDYFERLKTAVGEERIIISNGIDEIARIRAEKEKKVVARMKVNAEQRIDIVYTEYLEAKRIYDDYYADFEAVKTGERISSALGINQDDLDKARAIYSQAAAEYNVWRKLVENSNVSVLPETEVKVTQRRLRRLKDYWLQTVIEIQKFVADKNLSVFGDETLDLDVRLAALKKSAKLETEARRNEFKIQVNDAEDKLASEIASIEASIEKGTVARAKGIAQIEGLEKEKNDFIRLEAVKLSNDLIKINDDFIEKASDTTESVGQSRQLAAVENVFDKRIALAKKTFEASAKGAEDEKRLNIELVDAEREKVNAIIDLQIEQLNAQIETLRASGQANEEYINSLLQQIDKLEAGKITTPVDVDNWEDVWDEVLQITRQFSRAIGDIIDAQFDRRIENINAEIRAEEDKYDRLIALAEDNEEQQKTLERNKEDRLKKLERDRLKEEQKAAKAKKKFAVADIMINTARAIVGIWADFPKVDFGATAAIMTGVMSALGAAQIAAVLSAPIPQYRKGVDNLSKDQVAMINDGGFKEYVERNGRILSTDRKNAVVALKKGDTVYKDYEDMVSRSSIFKIKNINAQRKHGEMQDLTESFSRALNKTKLKNNITVRNVIRDDRYRDSQSRWT
jgi:tape measure domain-containing protein